LGENHLLKADLHMHTRFSKDGLMSPEVLVRTCQKRGVTCAAVTDHNRLRGSLEVRDIAPFLVIPSEEVMTAEGEIIGFFLTEEIPPYLSPEETASRIRQQGGLVCVPHPFDRIRHSRLNEAALTRLVGLNLVDIIEAQNARTTFRTDNLRAADFARQFGLPLSAGSDAHGTIEIGRSYLQLPDFETRDQFLDSLRQAILGGGLSPFYVHGASLWARFKKRLAGRQSAAR
jgi:predicted metal-dependent phosphoesterase TrpH